MYDVSLLSGELLMVWSFWDFEAGVVSTLLFPFRWSFVIAAHISDKSLCDEQVYVAGSCVPQATDVCCEA